MIFRLLSSLRNTIRDAFRWFVVLGLSVSWFKIMRDILILKLYSKGTSKHVREVRFPDGTALKYRLNKGDLWSMREVLLDECYRFPGEINPKTFVDLGANIGLTSYWMSRHYPLEHILMVEPDVENARIAKLNLAAFQAGVFCVEGAVGSKDGFARFKPSDSSNLGSIQQGEEGDTRVYSMDSLLKVAGIPGSVDLLKIDIEGGEADLFSANTDWLEQVGAIIAEFHPDVIDVEPVIQAICKKGFRHIKPGSVFPSNMEAFLRSDNSGTI